MLIAKNIQVYVKTTDTCNLNCSHCFTSGSRGSKNIFSPKNTIHFLTKLIEAKSIESMNLLFHGGEPMIATVSELYSFYEKALELPLQQVTFGIQTNLVYTLTKERISFFKKVFHAGIGTSWDSNIRFGSTNIKLKDHQLDLWENNVRLLKNEGIAITLMVSLTKHLIENFSPKEILDYATSLDIDYIQFERITDDGNAILNNDIRPSNLAIDTWFLRMYHTTIENKYYTKIKNMFLNEIAQSIVSSSHIGNRCRNCEQSIITIGATGQLSGCPNSATNDQWGNINDDLMGFLGNPKRVQAICNEKNRNNICLTCNVNYLCNGDCYKLKWEEEICPAPVSLLRELSKLGSHKELERLMI